MKKTRSFKGIVSVAAIVISYLLIRFPLFNMHGMKEWPNMLAILSIGTIVLASIFKKRKIFIGVIVGYLGGFALAMLFNRSGFDQGGGTTNNAWIIWTVFLILSILFTMILSYRKKN